MYLLQQQQPLIAAAFNLGRGLVVHYGRVAKVERDSIRCGDAR